MSDFQFSPQYLFVRGRQLEGTYPGNASTGIWPITAMRISHGWGVPLEKDWPYDGRASEWPPKEPSGIDVIAKRYRMGRYQRVRTFEECKRLLNTLNMPFMASFEITDKWAHASNGVIPELLPGDTFIGSHTVLVFGCDDQKQQIIFRNSWGQSWGDRGNGYMSYDTFMRCWVEGWIEDMPGLSQDNDKGSSYRSEVAEYSWKMKEHGGGIFHAIELVRESDDERLAWAFAIERNGKLEVEDLFVRPQFRRQGLATRLICSLKVLANDLNASLLFWISFADTASENLQIIQKLIDPLGLTLQSSGIRWAAFVADVQHSSSSSAHALPKAPILFLVAVAFLIASKPEAF